jgi:type I restriction enzyme S subunit
MNRIEELIQQLCPEGVEWKKISEVLHKVNNIRWPDNSNSEFRYIDLSSVNRTSHFIVETQIINSKTAPSRAMQIVKQGDVIFGTTRPLLKRYAVITKEYDGQICSTGFCVLRPDSSYILTNFLFHLLGTEPFYQYIESNEQGASYPSISDSAIKNFQIPIPPLAIQNEIVNILDLFTRLEAELEAELEARKMQYTYYRDTLLNFEGKDVEWKTLGDVCKSVLSGGTPLANKQEYYSNGTIPWLRTQEVRFNEIFETEMKITELALKESSAKWIPANCVIIAISGATAARSAINRIPLTTNQHCCCLNIDAKKANYRFVFHWVSCKYEQLKSLGQGARSDLNSSRIKSFPIPVPPLSEQERIVGILDKFDALVNDLSSGLPAEIKARRQQYEYYRDQLLTFKNREHG